MLVLDLLQKLGPALVGTAAAIAILSKLARRAYSYGKRVTASLLMIEAMAKELKPNSGTSLRDAINRIDRNTTGANEKAWMILEQSDRGHFECDETGKWLRVNKRWSTLTGVSNEDAKGYGWILGVGANQRVDVRQVWESAITEKRIFDTQFLTPSGILIHSRANPVKDDRGVIIGWLGTNDVVVESEK